MYVHQPTKDEKYIFEISTPIRGATVRGKSLENEIFSRSGNFNFSQGNLEKAVKI